MVVHPLFGEGQRAMKETVFETAVAVLAIILVFGLLMLPAVAANNPAEMASGGAILILASAGALCAVLACYLRRQGKRP